MPPDPAQTFIASFVAALEAAPHRPDLCNPYRLPGRSANLAIYLEAMWAQPGRRVLLVGEALGYRGGLHTGIPFSSSRLLNTSGHPFWRRLRPRLTCVGDIGEASASIVWEALARRRRQPLFWNALPFHPHLPGLADSNRPPRAGELAEGLRFLQALAEAYRPDIVAGVGGKGSAAARRALPEASVTALRHPSYGGKVAFQAGLHRLLA